MTEIPEVPEGGPDYEYFQKVAWVSMLSVADGLAEEWGDVAEMDQHLAESKEMFIKYGLNVEDPETLWMLSILTERLLSSIADHAASCVAADHLLAHVRYGAANVILTLASALRTYASPPT